ncbi:MAG: hypothetical protein IPG10_06470 [Flavobacteriales bacterium]|nr:hypothetical protein [Flavobacteriales bacterium]
MTSRASLLVLMAVLASRCLTQPQIEWQRCLGGSADDEVNDVLETPDGGYILACMTMSADGDVTMNHGWSDAWLVKLDQGGNIEWQRTYGGTSGERAQAIDLTADGGFIVAGSSGSDDGDLTQNHGMNDMWLFKVDATGDLQWQRSFGDRDMRSPMRFGKPQMEGIWHADARSPRMAMWWTGILVTTP